MKDSGNFYLTSLYPFQDGVIRIMRTLNTPFFLTGGTALARGYLGHRYSDDLDFFVNDDSAFLEHVRRFEDALRNSSSEGMWQIDEAGTIRSERFISFSLLRGDVLLKIDLVNDIAFRVGDIVQDKELGALDTIGNMISNKIGALFRYAEKDIADIWAIWKKYGASWPEVMQNAQRKDAGIDAVSAAEIIGTFPSGRFDKITWSNPVDRSSFFVDLRTISEEILGLSARLFPQ